jgi:hypothetical protein
MMRIAGYNFIIQLFKIFKVFRASELLGIVDNFQKVADKKRQNLHLSPKMEDGLEDGFSNLNRGTDQKLSPGYARKIVCRYGRGCTHKSDPSHRDRFWHPDVPDLSHEQIRTHYICYECGESFINLVDLQVNIIYHQM